MGVRVRALCFSSGHLQSVLYHFALPRLRDFLEDALSVWVIPKSGSRLSYHRDEGTSDRYDDDNPLFENGIEFFTDQSNNSHFGAPNVAQMSWLQSTGAISECRPAVSVVAVSPVRTFVASDKDDAAPAPIPSRDLATEHSDGNRIAFRVEFGPGLGPENGV